MDDYLSEIVIAVIKSGGLSAGESEVSGALARDGDEIDGKPGSLPSVHRAVQGEVIVHLPAALLVEKGIETAVCLTSVGRLAGAGIAHVPADDE